MALTINDATMTSAQTAHTALVLGSAPPPGKTASHEPEADPPAREPTGL